MGLDDSLHRALVSHRAHKCLHVEKNGAAPTRGDLRTSPGRFSGEDHAWVGALAQPYLFQYFKDLAKYPNRPTAPCGGSMNELVDASNNPEELQRLMRLLEPSSQVK
mgnify:CR=1 FL=1